MKTIIKCSAIIIRNRSLLLTRKQGTTIFISPGGKPLQGEDHLSCLRREIREELNVEAAEIRPFGLFHGIAEFESVAIENHVYQVEVVGQPVASSEIAEIAWVNYRKPPCEVGVASVFRDNVLPLLYQKELID
ncbi:NUDIX domain-containing protein [Rahnella sp. SAP-1]|jgi:8-oxo-dGTP pyrophosphatase MutT (NUDIX family)|uniref:NUDIX domain-containing protein n=1 Tax=Rouxiella aceris TaxID=2703884 RepID=A0A848MGL4_9GAMM|nr:NUDIX domain-containing protein [Rouxiella aceris]NMP26162.1 NUDIX domain-containing protein [Rouxiella aceris]